MVSKQNTDAKKPKATTVESVEIVPIRQQPQAASIAPTDRICGASFLTVDRNVNRISAPSTPRSTYILRLVKLFNYLIFV